MSRYLLRVVHPSWLIGWCCLGIVVGAGLCVVADMQLFSDTAWLVFALSILLVSFLKRHKWMLGLIFVAGCLIGLWRGSQLKVDLNDYNSYYGSTIVLQGRITQDASIDGKGVQRLNVSSVIIDGTALKGSVWISVAGGHNIKRGDTIRIKGVLNEGFGNLSATMYRAQILDIIRPNPGDVARRVRDWFGNSVRTAIPEPQASLGLGYLVGQKTALPPDLDEEIKIVGLTHAVVASGYNLTILVMFSRTLFSKVSKYFATISSGLLVAGFMLVTGLSPSMTRAGLVAGLGLLVWYYGRKMHPFILLSFAAAVTILVNPSYIWGDLGWYLSFGSFIGVIVLAPLLQHYFWGLSRDVPLFRQLLIDTSSAQIVTTPLILVSFGQFSVYALPANMLVLPAVPLAMLCTFIAGVVGLVAPPLADIAGLPATIILRYSTEVISRMANLPSAQKDLVFNIELMVISYILIGATIVYLKRSTDHDFRSDNIEKF